MSKLTPDVAIVTSCDFCIDQSLVRTHDQVVLQVLADLRAVVEGRHPHLQQVLRVPHPGQQQQLGRADGAGREDHLLPGEVLGHAAESGHLGPLH